MDLGLINAVGTGLNSYSDARQQQFQNKQSAYLQALNSAKAGYTNDNGTPTPTDLTQQQQTEQSGELAQKQEGLVSDSPTSERTRQLTRGLMEAAKPGSGQYISDDMSANEINNNPYVKETISGGFQVQGRQATANAAAERAGNRQDQAATNLDTKNMRDDSNLVDKNLDQYHGRANALMNLRQGLQKYQRADTLANLYEGNNLPKAQMVEVASLIDGGISGGVLNEQRIKSMLPDTAGGSWASAKEWLTGNPQGQEQQEFVKNWLKTSKAETDLQEAQIKEGAYRSVGDAGERIKASDPSRFSRILRGKGLDAAEYEQAMQNRAPYQKLIGVYKGDETDQQGPQQQGAAPQQGLVGPQGSVNLKTSGGGMVNPAMGLSPDAIQAEMKRRGYIQ